MNSSTNNNTILSPYLLSRFHQHLNHLNDMAFAHTKILQEIIEKRSIESMTSSSSPHGSISSSPSSSSSTIDSSQQRKRSYPCNDDNHEIKNENKRPRKQSKPQQLLKTEQNQNEQPSSLSEEEQEMGEINESIDKQVFNNYFSYLNLSFSILFRLLFQFHHQQCYHLYHIISHFLIIYKI
jgi:hypothetical protein